MEYFWIAGWLLRLHRYFRFYEILLLGFPESISFFASREWIFSLILKWQIKLVYFGVNVKIGYITGIGDGFFVFVVGLTLRDVIFRLIFFLQILADFQSGFISNIIFCKLFYSIDVFRRCNLGYLGGIKMIGSYFCVSL